MKGGLFIAPSGQVEPVSEHIHAVIADPAKYGVRAMPAALDRARAGNGEAREEVLRAVMKNGWIRVRGHKTRVAVQGYDLGTREKLAVIAALQGERVHDDDALVVEDFRSGARFTGTFAEYRASENEARRGPWTIYDNPAWSGLGSLVGRARRGLAAAFSRRQDKDPK